MTMSQNGPVKPGVHTQRKKAAAALGDGSRTHAAPFLHGCEAHGSLGSSHCTPVKPGMHWHLYMLSWG